MVLKYLLFFAAIALNQVLSLAIEPPYRFVPSPFFAAPLSAIIGDLNKTLEDIKDKKVTTPSEDELSVNLTANIIMEVENETTYAMETSTHAVDEIYENNNKREVETKNDTEATTIYYIKTTIEMDENSVNNSEPISEILNAVEEISPTQVITKVDKKREVQSTIENRELQAPCNPNQNLCKPSCVHYPNSPYPCQHVAMYCRNRCRPIPNDSPPIQPPCCVPSCSVPPNPSSQHIPNDSPPIQPLCCVPSCPVPPNPSCQNPCQYVHPCHCLASSCSAQFVPPCAPPAKSICQNPCCPCGYRTVDPCDSPSSSGIAKFFRCLSKLFNVRMQVEIPLTSDCVPQIRVQITEGRGAEGYDEVDLRRRRGISL